MSKLSLEELRALRARVRPAMLMRDPANKTKQVIVALGECGIAAGAKKVFDAFVEELLKRNATDVLVRTTDCLGKCELEPQVLVVAPGMPAVVYGKVDVASVNKIIDEHLTGGKLVEGLSIVDQPVLA